MDSSTVYAQRVVQPTWGGTVIHAEVTYPFSDLALARRLERAEASRNAAFVETRAELQPGLKATWTEVAGAYAMFRSASRRVLAAVLEPGLPRECLQPMAQLDREWPRLSRVVYFFQHSGRPFIPMAEARGFPAGNW